MGRRDATIVLVAYRHGLRAAELVDIHWRSPPRQNRASGARALDVIQIFREQPES
jgi:hypothetical protein